MDKRTRLITALATCLIFNPIQFTKHPGTANDACGIEPDSRTSNVNRIELGRLATGSAVSFSQSDSGEWGIEIVGAETPQLSQQQPARLEVFRKIGDIR